MCTKFKLLLACHIGPSTYRSPQIQSPSPTDPPPLLHSCQSRLPALHMGSVFTAPVCSACAMHDQRHMTQQCSGLAYMHGYDCVYDSMEGCRAAETGRRRAPIGLEKCRLHTVVPRMGGSGRSSLGVSPSFAACRPMLCAVSASTSRSAACAALAASKCRRFVSPPYASSSPPAAPAPPSRARLWCTAQVPQPLKIAGSRHR